MKQLLFFFALLFSFCLTAQPTQVIKVKKNDDNLYFFQKGKSTDTISKNKGDLFYLLPKTRLKKILIIHIENAQLLRTDNDSLFRVNYVKGISYECVYEKSYNLEKGENEYNAKDLEKKAVYSFKCQINGVATENKNKIVFRLKVKNEVNPFLENVFYYKE